MTLSKLNQYFYMNKSILFEITAKAIFRLIVVYDLIRVFNFGECE